MMLPSFSIHCTWLRVDHNCILKHDYVICTTSCVGGFNLRLFSTFGLHSLSIWILWVQMPRGIPTMSAIVQPISFIYLLNTSRRNFSFRSRKSILMITGKCYFPPTKHIGNGKEPLSTVALVVVRLRALREDCLYFFRSSPILMDCLNIPPSTVEQRLPIHSLGF